MWRLYTPYVQSLIVYLFPVIIKGGVEEQGISELVSPDKLTRSRVSWHMQVEGREKKMKGNVNNV